MANISSLKILCIYFALYFYWLVFPSGLVVSDYHCIYFLVYVCCWRQSCCCLIVMAALPPLVSHWLLVAISYKPTFLHSFFESTCRLLQGAKGTAQPTLEGLRLSLWECVLFVKICPLPHPSFLCVRSVIVTWMDLRNLTSFASGGAWETVWEMHLSKPFLFWEMHTWVIYFICTRKKKEPQMIQLLLIVCHRH